MVASNRILGKDGTYIIADAGQNHNGDMLIALNLIVAAKKSGADAVKFTKMSIDDSYTKKALDREYNSKHSFGKTYGEHRKKIELDFNQMFALKVFAESLRIELFWSVCDIKSLYQMESLKNPIIKIPSREIANMALLKEINKIAGNRPVILSTGLGIKQTIEKALNTLKDCRVYLCHCVSEYPTPPEHMNLNILNSFKEEYGNRIEGIGLSSHMPGITDGVLAVAYGVKIIEKHITINRNMKGTDHMASLELPTLQAMVSLIREAELCMGNKKIHIRYPKYVRRDMLKRKQINGDYRIE